jgi:OOP family OmpA-OmpF porin
VIQYRGCPEPDEDKDGVPDAFDKCPSLVGLAANNGCPEITGELEERIKRLAKQIFFNTGSATLTTRSYTALDEMASVLKSNPGLQLTIEGHTDNIGKPEKNQLLSEDRANAVMNYLQQTGIQVSRLKANGFGEQRPVANNGTLEGRAVNRRVEFNVRY